MRTPQYMEALAKANTVRIAHADLRHEVNEGQLSLADALLDQRAVSMTVFELLSSQHRWGRHTSMRVLRGLRIGEWKRVGALTERQRGLLVAECEPERKAV